MLKEKLSQYNIILASKSPRRQELLKGLELDFEIKTKEIEEIFPDGLYKEEIPLYLSNLKANAFKDDLKDKDLVITSDTIVWCNNKQFGKPTDKLDATNMLTELSNKPHEVITAVTLMTKEKKISFFDTTKVFFKRLSNQEINHYVNTYQPFDKAGSYGIQEWIGFAGIEKIEGDYFNVVGLPLHKLYIELNRF